MKRTLILTLLIIASIASTFAQYKAKGNKPGTSLNPDPGYIMINEITYAVGIGGTTGAPYSNNFYGFTTIHGYQVNKDFMVAGGAGISIYNGGTMIPIFLDVRYRVYVSQWTPYIFGDGGFLFNINDSKDTRLFVNPGIGCSYATSRNLAFNFGAGLFTQFGDVRDSFINMKLGVVYKFETRGSHR